MKKLSIVSCFLLFYLGFFCASYYRFKKVIFDGDQSIVHLLVVVALACFSGVMLYIALAQLELVSKNIFKKIVYGSLIGVSVFSGLYLIEDFLSKSKLFGAVNDKSFSEVKGHCGVYVGRAVQKFYQSEMVPDFFNTLAEYRIRTRCRNNHFLKLNELKKICNNQSESKISCFNQWMDQFAVKGYWNPESRRMFLNLVKQNSENDFDQNALLSYALKDYELEMARPSTLKQAGLDEQFSDQFLYYKQSDELHGLQMTKEVFAYVKSKVGELETGHPNSIADHFSDASKEVSIKLDKIPELENELKQIQVRNQL